MNDRRRPTPDDPTDPIADAASLLGDDPRPAPAPKPPQAPSASSDGYEVESWPEDDDGGPSRPPVPPVAAPRAKVPKLRPEADDADDAPRARRGRDATESAVDEVWTRGAEWGGTVTQLAVAAVVLLGLLYAAVQIGFVPAFLVLVLGGAGLLFLCYPIFITIERPVRITPEQAAQDYFGALSHHWPHYKRMWLLLSNAGRVSGQFASFEGFRTYWTNRLAELKRGKAPASTPLKFTVEDFRSEKSAGQTSVEATYVVKVVVRGKNGEGPIHSIKVTSRFTKGPDRMWYLDKGTLPSSERVVVSGD